MIDFHHAEDSILTIAVKPMHDFDRYGTVIIKDNKVVGFEEKTFKRCGYINGGVYTMKKQYQDFLTMIKMPFHLRLTFCIKK